MFIFVRMFELPLGVFEYIVEFIPFPRMWHWQLMKIESRCQLAPQIAVYDLCNLINEILVDSGIFRGKDQSDLIVKLARNAEV
jgi:hypothetical protein